MAIEIVKAVFEAIVSPFLGLWNLADGMLAEDGISPIGAGLQDPAVTWAPLVTVLPEQKLMKLLVLWRESASPAALPLPLANAGAMTDLSKVREVCKLPALPPALLLPPVAPLLPPLLPPLPPPFLFCWRARRAASGTAIAVAYCASRGTRTKSESLKHFIAVRESNGREHAQEKTGLKVGKLASENESKGRVGSGS